MNCKKCSEKLSLYVLNELPQKEADEISEHLKNCEKCSAQVIELTALLHDIPSIEEIEPPSDFLEKLSSKAEKELWTNTGKVINYRRYIRYIRYSSIAAMFLICIFSVVYFNASGKLRSTGSYDRTAASNSSQSASADNAKGAVKSNEFASSTALKADTAKTVPESTKRSDAISNNTDTFVAHDVLDASPKSPEVTIAPKSQDSSLGDTQTIVNIYNQNAVGSIDKDVLPTPTSSKHVQLLSQQVEVKTKNRDDAISWISEQASKLNGEVIPTFSASLFTTQESTYFAAKSAATSAKRSMSDTIIVEVKSENAEQFRKSIEEYFGLENLQFGIVENVTADTMRYVIKVLN